MLLDRARLALSRNTSHSSLHIVVHDSTISPEGNVGKSQIQMRSQLLGNNHEWVEEFAGYLPMDLGLLYQKIPCTSPLSIHDGSQAVQNLRGSIRISHIQMHLLAFLLHLSNTIGGGEGTGSTTLP